jgi:HK97 family phage portal protein
LATVEKREHWWQKIFKKKEDPMLHYLREVLSGVAPIFSTDYGESVYASDVVQQAIYSIVTELKKLDPVHVRRVGMDFSSVEGNVQRVLDDPNPMMTTSDFIEKVAWTLLLNYNAFIYPIWNGDTLTALYPLQPSQVEFDTDYSGTGKTWVRFTFPNGYVGDVPYENVIHLRYKFSVSEFMGGNENGQPDFKALTETIKLNDTLLKGLAKSLNIQTSVNGVVKTKTMKNSDEQMQMIRDFEKKLQANESGMLPIDISADYMPITKQVQLLDATTLEFIDKKILRTWGVSIPIVNGDYTKEQYEAFYQKTLEPIVKSFGQAFTKGIFTKHEAQGFKNEIVFYVKELIFMNTDQKLSLFENLSAQGGVYINEYRTAFGMRPDPALQGVRMMSLNWINAEDAKQYQTGQNDGGNASEGNGGVNDGET